MHRQSSLVKDSAAFYSSSYIPSLSQHAYINQTDLMLLRTQHWGVGGGGGGSCGSEVSTYYFNLLGI
jgi:hypothetical protein